MEPALSERSCQPCRRGTPPLSGDAVEAMMPLLPGWSVRDGRALVREFTFADYASALRWVNAVSWLAELEDHHPDVKLRWGGVELSLSTHSIGGLSENDFILAAKVNVLERTAGSSGPGQPVPG